MTMTVRPRVKDALARLRAVFSGTACAELSVADAARLAGLDDEVCLKLLHDLCETGVIEKRRRGTFAVVRHH
jgi:hypothetical protein